MRLFELAELDEMISAAKAQKCDDAQSLAATETFIGIIDSAKKDCQDYLTACERSQAILKQKVTDYKKLQSTWDNL